LCCVLLVVGAVLEEEEEEEEEEAGPRPMSGQFMQGKENRTKKSFKKAFCV
jgi:hypothetical protein